MLLNKNVITVQHPESIHHTNGMIGSWTDWELTKNGILQAENIARNIRKEFQDIRFATYSSPLKRTMQTAEILGKELHCTPKLSDALKERSLGKAIGKSVQWLKDNIENEEKTIYDKCFIDAESRFDVWNRLLSFYNEIMSNDDENIIIVSHGDTLSIFNVMWLGLDPETLHDIDLSGVSGGVSFLHRKAFGKKIIKRLSDTSYALPF
ncbi:putative phosphoglycerate mutase [Epilithonimonas hungarica]|uniref:histidine phosphatase family protein n=1 Tax=Epilithonimonas hungarica TaxID=454006 RepID=UPI00278948A8|nr:histidine phosphatase family protein [Epilithonimonas hungarica]MDP9956006.1 putative phosphoglycerate mutase [Epilithonimonas hungarica]